MKILLMGNPNVGKSCLFSRLTGVNVMVSNYSGTTVEFKQGKTKLGNKIVEIIDVPGTYSLKSTCKAEEVALKMLKEGDMVINVVDATNLERNLNLTLQLLEKNIPMIVALNFWDEAKHKGIDLNVKKLKELLKVPVIPVVAVTGEGVKEVTLRLKDAKAHSYKYSSKKRWNEIGKIIRDVQVIRHKHHSFLEVLEDLTIKPITGIPLAVLVLVFSFYMIRIIGEGLINYVFGHLFNLYLPLLERLSEFLGKGLIHDILIGTLIEGKIDYVQSMGLLSTGLFVPIGMILPYIFSFYLVLSFLEDSGYLPRFATLVDTVMHKLGMHGLAIIPMILGVGCNVPGALATRILESKRQRFIALTLMAITIPCMAQIAMVYGLLGRYGVTGLGIIFITLLVVWIIIGLILNKLMKGIVPETFIEISPYRLPYLEGLSKKLLMRMRAFLKEAIPYVLLGVFIVNILYVLGIIDFLSSITAPVIEGVLGLPKDAIASLLIGFLRKDVAVGMLLPLGLTMKQLIIASVILTMYFPCVATFVILFRELGLKDTLKSALLMIVSTLIIGAALNIIL